MTPAELRARSAPRVFDAFFPDRLYNHDAEDPGIAVLGDTEQGETVELNRRAAESDLLVYVNINIVTMDGGHKSVADRPRAPTRSLRAPPQRRTRMRSLALVHGPAGRASCTAGAPA